MDTDDGRIGAEAAPICSVCIANYNGINFIEACLDSVLDQDFSLPIEVIVHDDASSDGSADLVAEEYPMARLIRSRTNVGFCVSNNRMAAVARGRYILLLNNDATLRPDAMSSLYRCAVEENCNGIIGLPQYDMRTGELLDMGSLFDPFLNPIPNLDRSRRDVGMVMGACMWLPKSLWDELGGFPEWFESVAEDMYLCCCARLRGYPVIALSESGYDHWVGRSFGGGKVVRGALLTKYRRRCLSERNKSWVMLICSPHNIAFFLFPLHFLALVMEGLSLSFIRADRRIWRDIYKSCFKSIWLERKKIFILRKIVQSGKRIPAKSFYAVYSMIPRKLAMLLKYGLPSIE